MERRTARSKRTDTLLPETTQDRAPALVQRRALRHWRRLCPGRGRAVGPGTGLAAAGSRRPGLAPCSCHAAGDGRAGRPAAGRCKPRSEEHTSELQSLMRISYDVFCLNNKKTLLTTQPDLRLI